MKDFYNYLRNLNLFSDDGELPKDPEELKSKQYATRFYLFSLVIVIISIVLYLSFTVQTELLIIRNPSVDQYLNMPKDADCPCSQLSVTYKSFTSAKIQFHPICSSDFVSERWLKTLFLAQNKGTLYRGDIRNVGSAQFRGLSSLCRLSQSNVWNSLEDFYETRLTSPRLMFKDLFMETVQSAFEQFQLSVPFTFVSNINLILKMTFGSQLISGLETSFRSVRLTRRSLSPMLYFYVGYQYRNSSKQYCGESYDFVRNGGIYLRINPSFPQEREDHIGRSLFEVPGWYTGCMPLASLMVSSLECFYNQTCIELLLSYFSTNESFSALATNDSSIFQIESTIESIFVKMAVESWSWNANYETYFQRCAPRSCTYWTTTRNDYTYTLTKIVGLLGTIVLILRIVSPVLIKIFIKCLKKTKRVSQQTSIRHRLLQLVTIVKRQVVRLNLFKRPSNIDSHENYQQITTRVYLFLLVSSIIVTGIYLSLVKDTQRRTILEPNELEFFQLEEIHKSQLSCPCSSLSIPYKSFMHIDPVYHPVCLSDFVSTDWIQFLLNEQLFTMGYQSYRDRISWGTQFNTLRQLCSYSQNLINYSLSLFNQTSFISAEVLTENVFNTRTRYLIEDWKSRTLTRFNLTYQLIRKINEGNQIMNDAFNFNLALNNYTGKIEIIPANYSDCFCDFSQSCHAHTWIDRSVSQVSYLIRPTKIDQSFYVGCDTLEAMLKSSFDCLFNQSCIDKQVTPHYGQMPPKYNISAIQINGTLLDEKYYNIDSAVSNMLVLSWIQANNYSLYYNSCKPESCSFNLVTRRSLKQIIVSLITVIGGLSTLLKILLTIILRSIEKLSVVHTSRDIKLTVKELCRCTNRAQITNRLHLFLLIVSLIAFYIGFFIPQQWITVQIEKADLSKYLSLSNLHKDSLHCPCSTATIPYSNILTIRAQFHPICQSNLTSDSWMKHVYQLAHGNPYINHTDFLVTAFGQYQLLGAFCQLTSQIIQTELSHLMISGQINGDILSLDQFHLQVEEVIKNFREQTPMVFVNTMNLIRELTAANNLMSMSGSNWRFLSGVNGTQYSEVYTVPLNYGQCSCGFTPKCSEDSRGMKSGCYALEALLQTSFECFYDQDCIDPTNRYLSLDASSTNYFQKNMTVEQVLEHLMVDEFHFNYSYSNYFTECAPKICSYSYMDRRETIDVFVALISLYSGLFILSGWVAAWIYQVFSHVRMKIHPHELRKP